jgi:hypothetical protein
MATKIVPSLRSALERLKHAGAVNGLCLAWRRQILINLMPFQDFRVEQAVHAMQEAREHYAGGGHDVQCFWFGFDGVHMLGCFHGECALLVLHTRAVEVDFISRAAAAFLEDAQLLVNAALNPSESDLREGDTERIAGPEDGYSGGTNLVTRMM